MDTTGPRPVDPTRRPGPLSPAWPRESLGKCDRYYAAQMVPHLAWEVYDEFTLRIRKGVTCKLYTRYYPEGSKLGFEYTPHLGGAPLRFNRSHYDPEGGYLSWRY